MRSDNIPPQIPPLRIITLNQFHLPRPPPLLNLLFPRNRRRQIRAQLKINQPINIIFLRKLTPPFAPPYVARTRAVKSAVIPV